MTDTWAPEPRAIPAELTDEYQPATYPPPPTRFPRIEDQLDTVMRDRIRDLFGVAR